jgi:predicted MPP superfamily phosphohydrolase
MASPSPFRFGRPACALALLLAVASSSHAQTLSGVVFDDRNTDGVRQAGEPGLVGVVVSNQIDVVQTAADGAYQLPGRGYGVAYVTAPRGRATVGAFWRAIPAGDSPRVDFPLAAASDTDDFTFIHASDTHIAPASVPRTHALLKIVADRKPDLVMISGDLIRDALRVPEAEATSLYELYLKEMAASTRPIWSAPGNHEIFGIERHLSLVSPKNPLYGKGMYRKYLGPNYYSFNRGRVHFIALDTVDVEDLWYYGHVDKAQLDWLVKDLSFVPKGTTVVTFNHIPFFSAGMSVSGYTDWGTAPSLLRVGDKMVYRHVVSNAADVIDRLKDYRYTLSLAGHNHSYEHLSLSPKAATETRLHLTAAVIGPRPGLMPSPSGVTLYRVKGDVIDDGEFVPLDGPGR